MDPDFSDLLAPWLPRLRAARHCYVGFSGGLDSTVLLQALHARLPRGGLTAVHVNHGLSLHADRWQAHCEARCSALGVPLRVERVQVVPAGEGLEQAARARRYRVFESLLGADDVLVLAHHRDDQVETVLYRLLRGAGPRGLAGMPASRPLGAGILLRPFLTVDREVLKARARDAGLDWVEDESNARLDADRNYIRHELLPRVASRWSGYRSRVARSALHCAEADALLSQVGREDLAALGERPERRGFSLALEGFGGLTPERQANVLRVWLTERGLSPPGHSAVRAVLGELLPARDDASPLVEFGQGRFRRFRGRLYLEPGPLPAPTRDLTLVWEHRQPLALPGGFVLEALVGPSGLRVAPGDRLEVRFRRGGERCRPAGRGRSHPLKKLLQDYGLEPWLREWVPLVFSNGELAAVGDLFLCEGFVAGAGEPGWVLRWR